MQKVFAKAVVLAVATMCVPAFADLTVTTDLGTLATSTTRTLTGTNAGLANNAFVYSSSSNTSSVVWGNGEYVYQFTLAKPAYIYLNDTLEPDDTGSFPFPDHDYFLLNTLTTVNSDNTATNANFNFSGKPEGQSLAFVQNSVGPTTSGSASNSGIFRSAASNPKGLYAAGTYYMSVDQRSGTVTTTGTASAPPPARFSTEFNVKYVDEVVAPTAAATALSSAGSVSGNYAPGQVVFVAFDYTAGTDFSVNTLGNTLDESGGDTVLALYDSAGALIKFNDDAPAGGGLAYSQIDVAAGEGLASGRYYLGLTEYKAVINPGFAMSVYRDNVGATGTWVINGLTSVPEPTSLLALAAVPAIALRRRRR